MRLHRLVLVMIVALSVAARAQQPGPAAAVPVVKPVAEGVYIFEYRGYQSMFVVDPEGVIVDRPDERRRREGLSCRDSPADVGADPLRRLQPSPLRSHRRRSRRSRRPAPSSSRIATRAFSSSA